VSDIFIRTVVDVFAVTHLSFTGFEYGSNTSYGGFDPMGGFGGGGGGNYGMDMGGAGGFIGGGEAESKSSEKKVIFQLIDNCVPYFFNI
jgi:hypothetical protein